MAQIMVMVAENIKSIQGWFKFLKSELFYHENARVAGVYVLESRLPNFQQKMSPNFPTEVLHEKKVL